MTVETTVSSGSVPALLPVRGADRHDRVAVDLCAGLVDRQHAVRVAVVRDAEVDVVARRPARDSGARFVEPQPTLMSMPSQSQLIAIDLGAQPAKRLGRGDRGSAVTAVHRDRQPGQIDVDRGDAVRDVALDGVVDSGAIVPTPAPVGRSQSRSRRAERLDLVLELVGQLEAVSAEELDAVVLRRVVRRRDDHATVGLELAHEQRDRGRRHDAGTAARRRRREQMPATSAASSISPLRRVSRPTTIRPRPLSPRKCPAASPSRKASSGVSSALAMPRTPSVPKSRVMRVPSSKRRGPPRVRRAPVGSNDEPRAPSAWRTAASCGPSSGRTSCARPYGGRDAGSRRA